MSGSESEQELYEVRGDLMLAALCIGQFRAPCELGEDHLLVRADEALMQALKALGMKLQVVDSPFTPAPIFAPDASVKGAAERVAAARRQVRTHISRFAEGEPEDNLDEIETGPGSNA